MQTHIRMQGRNGPALVVHVQAIENDTVSGAPLAHVFLDLNFNCRNRVYDEMKCTARDMKAAPCVIAAQRRDKRRRRCAIRRSPSSDEARAERPPTPRAQQSARRAKARPPTARARQRGRGARTRPRRARARPQTPKQLARRGRGRKRGRGHLVGLRRGCEHQTRVAHRMRRHAAATPRGDGAHGLELLLRQVVDPATVTTRCVGNTQEKQMPTNENRMISENASPCCRIPSPSRA